MVALIVLHTTAYVYHEQGMVTDLECQVERMMPAVLQGMVAVATQFQFGSPPSGSPASLNTQGRCCGYAISEPCHYELHFCADMHLWSYASGIR